MGRETVSERYLYVLVSTSPEKFQYKAHEGCKKIRNQHIKHRKAITKEKINHFQLRLPSFLLHLELTTSIKDGGKGIKQKANIDGSK